MRDLIKLTDDQIVQAFEAIDCYPDIGDEHSSDITFTRDSIDDFLAAAKNWNDHGTITQTSKTLIIESTQPRKGDTRIDLFVVDFGEVRGCVR